MKKKVEGVVPDKNWVPPITKCVRSVGTEHAGPCTLGQKQNPQIQAMLAMKRSKEWSNDNDPEASNIKTQGCYTLLYALWI